jgi:hypothetical protein
MATSKPCFQNQTEVPVSVVRYNSDPFDLPPLKYVTGDFYATEETLDGVGTGEYLYQRMFLTDVSSGSDPDPADILYDYTLSEVSPNIGNAFSAASEVEMLTLAANFGDIVIRTDSSEVYVLASNDPTVLADWWLLGSSGAATVPGGADTEVQFNDGGVFGGNSGLTYQKASNALSGTGPWTVSALSDIPSLTLRRNSAGQTNNVLQIQTETNSSLLNVTPTGGVSTGPGVPFSISATSPTATTGPSQAGIPVTITASPAVASTDTAGAAAGGSVRFIAGDAARNATGNANGGDIALRAGNLIGTGRHGMVLIGSLGTDGGGGFRDWFGGTGYGATASGTPYQIYLFGTAAPRFTLTSGGVLGFVSDSADARGTPDVLLRRRAAANPAWGAASATPVSYTHSLAADSRAGTDTDVAGASATLIPGVGTGTGAASRLLLGGPVLGSTGSAAQSVVTPVSIGGEVKADGTQSFLNVTGTLPASGSAETAGANLVVTGAGTAAYPQSALRVDLLAGYTGAYNTAAVYGKNATAFVNTGTAMTQGVVGDADTTKENIGVYGKALNSGATVNIGVAGAARGSSASPKGVGSLGYGYLTAATTTVYGVVGILHNGDPKSGLPTAQIVAGRAAAMFDNRAIAEAIILGRDNGTTVFSVNDGGGVNLMREVEANSTGIVGTPNVLAATESNSVMTNEGATALNVHLLPTAAKGLTFTFVVQDADGIRIAANTDDIIRIAESVTAATGFIESTVIGSVITLVAINATEWVAISVVGTWVI